MRNIRFIVPFLFISTLTFAQREDLIGKLDSITTLIDNRVDVQAGTSIVITQDQKNLYTASNGLSNIELGTQNKINTKYDLASIAKMFTGYAIATLEVEGKLSMDDNIQKYLKDFPTYEHNITISHLVHHTSGIKNWTYLIYQMGWSNEDRISTDQLLRAIYAQKSLDFVPGEKYRYCNSGYVLLTKIIEEVTGQSFVEWTNENIFRPLKMENSFFNDDQNKLIEGMASAYSIDSEGKAYRKVYNTSALGSSSLISNALDMAKWMNFLLNPPEEKKEIINTMFSTVALNDGSDNNYAYGIEIDSYNGIELIGHDGSWASFTSNMVILPEHNIGIFFANNYRINTRAILEWYLDTLFPSENEVIEDAKEETAKEPVVVSKELLETYTGTYKLGEAWYLDITIKDHDLYTRANGERAFYMRPVNDSTFEVRNYGNRTITFNTNAQGKVHQLSYNNIDAKRKTSPFYFNEKEFKQFEGVYYSTELGLLYNIIVDKDKMYYTNIKTGTFELLYEHEKLFFSDGNLSKITFDYNAKKEIIGFHKVNSRGKKLFHFRKAN